MLFVKILIAFLICIALAPQNHAAPKESSDCVCVSLFYCDCRSFEPDYSDFKSRDTQESSDTGLAMIAITVSLLKRYDTFLLILDNTGGPLIVWKIGQ